LSIRNNPFQNYLNIYKIQTLNKIDPDGLQVFTASSYQIASDIADPDAILLLSF
jgi:D-3-phosphoglycerate dehydrogenase